VGVAIRKKARFTKNNWVPAPSQGAGATIALPAFLQAPSRNFCYIDPYLIPGTTQTMPRYANTAILLHWLIAILIVCTFLLGVTMVDIQGITPTKLKYFSWHKWLGVTVLGLVCLRLLWRLYHPAPPYPAGMPGWQQKAASGLHGLLYVLMFAVPLSGYFYSLAAGVPVVYLGLIPLPVLIDPNPEIKDKLKMLHFALNRIMVACVMLHILAALKHQFIDRDGVLMRMWPAFPSRTDKD